MGQLHVVQVIPDLGLGGAERMVLNLVRALDAASVRSSIVSLGGRAGTRTEHDIEGLSVPVRYLAKKHGFRPAMIVRLARVLRDLAPDVVHTHRSALAYVAPSLIVSRCPVVHTLHNVAEREVPWMHRNVHAFAFRLGAMPVAIGRRVGESFAAVYGRPPEAVVPIGIPVAQFAEPFESRSSWRAKERIAPDAVVFVCVARFAPQKNLARLVRAFATVASLQAGAVLLLAGDGPLLCEVQRIATELSLGDRVRFLRERHDIAALLASSDVFVLSSDWEGTPLSVMEAMGAGLPIVATDVGGVRDVVLDGKTGRLAAPGDVHALASAMLALGANVLERKKMGSAGAQVARNTLDASVMARRYEALYRNAVDRPKRREPKSDHT